MVTELVDGLLPESRSVVVSTRRDSLKKGERRRVTGYNVWRHGGLRIVFLLSDCQSLS